MESSDQMTKNRPAQLGLVLIYLFTTFSIDITFIVECFSIFSREYHIS